MTTKRFIVAASGAALIVSAPALADNITNRSFEEPGAPISTFLAWEETNNTVPNILYDDTNPFDLEHHATMFGQGLMGDNGLPIPSDTTLFQDAPGAIPGSLWKASIFVMHPASDPLMAGNFADLRLQFVDGAGDVVGSFSAGFINPATPTDTYTMLSVTANAPVGSVAARIVCRFSECDCPTRAGRVYFDDADLWNLSPGCNLADLAEPFGTLDFSDVIQFLTAFAAEDPSADLAAPTGVFDFSDVLAFLAEFGAGCP